MDIFGHFILNTFMFKPIFLVQITSILEGRGAKIQLGGFFAPLLPFPSPLLSPNLIYVSFGSGNKSLKAQFILNNTFTVRMSSKMLQTLNSSGFLKKSLRRHQENNQISILSYILLGFQNLYLKIKVTVLLKMKKQKTNILVEVKSDQLRVYGSSRRTYYAFHHAETTSQL